MRSIIKNREIVERARDLGRTNLLFIFGIIKAASIGLAVTVFLQLFIDLGPVWSWPSIWVHLPSFMQWGVSYLCLLVTFDAAMFATIFLVHIPKKNESFFTFLLVGTEALQFAILSPQLIKETRNVTIMSVPTEDWWYAIFCCYCIFMYCIVYFGKIEIENSKNEAQINIRPIINKYLASFWKAKLMILMAFIFSLSAFATLIYYSISNFHYCVRITTSSIFILMIFSAFFLQHKQREIIEKMFNAL